MEYLKKMIGKKQILIYLIYLLYAMLFTLIYFKATIYFTATGQYARATLQSLVNFTALKPFQYRILIPFLINILHRMVPINLILIYMFLTIIFVFFILIAFNAYLKIFLKGRWVDLASISILYPMLWNYASGHLNYPSDIPAILFFILGLTFLYKEKWLTFYLVFILASFNRETSVFLIFAFLLTKYNNLKLNKLMAHSMLLLILWAGIKIVLSNILFLNQGVQFENHISDNVAFLVSLVKFNPVSLSKFLVFGGMWILIPFGFNSIPKYIRSLLLIIPPFILGMFIAGNIFELRIYSELIPIIAPVAIYNIRSIMFEEG
jgi:hypothetical protein